MMKMIICIVGVICMMLLILLIISSCYLYNFKAKAALLPPGSMGWPIVGETLDLLRAGWDGCPERFIRERVERHGSSLVFKTSLLGDPVAVLCGPAGNKFLFSNENKLVAMWWPKSVRMVFGSCLITSGGEEAKWMRKMIHSYFTPDRNSHHTPIIDQLTRHHLLSHWHGKREVSVFEAIKSHTFKVACRLFMSLEDEDELEKLASLFHILLKGMIQIPFNLPGTRFNRAMRAASAIRKLILVIVKQRKSSLELAVLSSSSSQDLLSHLLLSCDDENGRFLTENEIVNNILTLLFAGHDTSTVAITLLIKTLGQLPQVYQQVLREQSEIAQAKGAGEMLQREDIQKMRYSWNVVSEVMRLSPPVIGAFREALVDFTYAGYIIPKGWKGVVRCKHEVDVNNDHTFARRDLLKCVGAAMSMELVASSTPFVQVVNAADLIQRRQRSEFQSSIKTTLYTALKGDPELIPSVLTLALNDIMTYDKATKTGGPNGSIRFSSEINRPENKGLSAALDLLVAAKEEIDLYSKGGPISYADLIQLAAQSALKATFLAAAIRKCGGNEEKGNLLYSAYGSTGQWGLFDRQFGRSDSEDADPEGRVPLWDRASVQEMKDKYKAVGFGPRQLAVMSAFFGPNQAATEALLATDPEVRPWVEKYQQSRETVSETNYEVDLITTLTKLSTLGQDINYEAYSYPVQKVDLTKLKL